MTITKLKAKNQVTIPMEIVKELNLRPNELLSVDTKENYIKLIPVQVEPRYSSRGLKDIGTIELCETNRKGSSSITDGAATPAIPIANAKLNIIVKEKNLFGKYGSGKGDLSKKRKKYLKEILYEKHRNS